jgi:hypothetical protein
LVLIFPVIPIFFFVSFLLVFDFDMVPNSFFFFWGGGGGGGGGEGCYELGFGIVVKCDYFDW